MIPPFPRLCLHRSRAREHATRPSSKQFPRHKVCVVNTAVYVCYVAWFLFQYAKPRTVFTPFFICAGRGRRHHNEDSSESTIATWAALPLKLRAAALLWNVLPLQRFSLQRHRTSRKLPLPVICSSQPVLLYLTSFLAQPRFTTAKRRPVKLCPFGPLRAVCLTLCPVDLEAGVSAVRVGKMFVGRVAWYLYQKVHLIRVPTTQQRCRC